MEAETYRYLVSSLIQAFAAILAGDLIFLVFRHDSLTKSKELYRQRLEQWIANLERRFLLETPAAKPYAADPNFEKSPFVSRADEETALRANHWIWFLDNEAIAPLYEKAKMLATEDEKDLFFKKNINPLIALKDHFSPAVLDFHNLCTNIDYSFKQFISPLVKTPAEAMVFFVFSLCLTDAFSNFTRIISSFIVIVVTVVALFQILDTVVRAVLHQYETVRHEFYQSQRHFQEHNEKVLKAWAERRRAEREKMMNGDK